jgi:hypothetical protein
MAKLVPRLLLIAVALFAVAGCSPSTKGEVSGTVTMDGKPVEDGMIAFFSVDRSAPTAGGRISDGRYDVVVNPGLCRVEIRVSKVVGEKKLYETADSPVRPIRAEALPPRYNDQSELQIDVKLGTNEQNYDLTTNGA